VAMHGDKSQGQRERALASFERGDVDTLVATDVAARGIDIDGISHVINFDPPADREGYVHRVGRTGRAGATGIGITFFGREHQRDLEKIADQLRLRAQWA
jgi:ATP-dependent RNA helicase RhlE